MTIKAKILCLVAAFACLAAAITGLGFKTMMDYNAIIAKDTHAADNALRAERLNRLMTAAAYEGRRLYMAKTPEEQTSAVDGIDRQATQLSEFITTWRSDIRSEELPKFAAVSAYVVDMARDGHILANLVRTQGLAAADAWGNRPEYRVNRQTIQAQIDRMVDRIVREQTFSRAHLLTFEHERQQQFLLIAGSGILLLLGASLWIAIDAIARPLNRVRQSMVDISEGAYETPIPDGKGGEIGQLWNALGILKTRAIEARRLSEEQIAREQKLRELVLD